MPKSQGKTPEGAGFFPSFSRGGLSGGMRRVTTPLYTPWILLLYFVALNAVAVGRERSSPHAMAICAGGSFRLGHPVQGFAVVEGCPGLGEDFGMADGAIALDPVVVQLVGCLLYTSDAADDLLCV